MRTTQSTTTGTVYPQRELETSFDPPANELGSVCVTPTRQELDGLVAAFRSLATTACGTTCTVVSIGAGAGLLEGLLLQAGVATVAVDLDFLPSFEDYSDLGAFCDVVRISSNQLYRIPPDDEQKTCLLCAYGKGVPLEAYLAAYPRLGWVAVIGDVPCPSSGDAVADPSIDCLATTAGWTTVHTQPISAVANSVAVIYQRSGA